MTDDLARALRESTRPRHPVNLSSLPFTRREATSIIKLVPQSQGLLALNFEANKTTATSPGLSQYRIVHFATHGLIDSLRPELSGIVLSLVDEEGKPASGFSRAARDFQTQLARGADCFGSCRTGLGAEIQGEGLVGMTRGFMYAGAARLVASQWKVDDEATAELGGDFTEDTQGGRTTCCGPASRADSDGGAKRLEVAFLLGGVCVSGRVEVDLTHYNCFAIA